MPPRKVLDQTTFDTLKAALKSNSYKERRDAVNQLAKFRDPRALEWLLPALKDSTLTVRRRVVAALTKYKDVTLLPHILPLLKDKTCRSQRLINKAVLDFGPAAEPYLLDALKDKNQLMRCAAAQFLAEIGSKRAVEPLIDLINPQEHRESFPIISALGKLGDSRIIEPLLAILRDAKADQEVRRSAALALQQFPGDKITETYFALLKNESPLLRAAALRCLEPRNLSAETLVPMLLSFIDDPDPQTVYQAFQGLKKFADEADVVDQMLAYLAEPNAQHWRAVDVLGYSHDPRAFGTLTGLLNDPRPPIRISAVEALGQLRDPRAVDLLIGLLKDPNERVQWSAEQALRMLKHPHELAVISAAK